MAAPSPGRIILLSGPSSSGKTSIGEALLPLLPDPWFLVPGDAIGALRSTSHTRVLDDAGTREMLRRTRLGYHRVVAALASAGNDVIMDCPLSEPWRLDDLLDVLDGYPVMFIDVRCSTEELTRRERARGDRPAGLAAAQAGVHGRADYDLVVDTTRRTAADCAGEVVERFTAMGRPGAFERLRRARQT